METILLHSQREICVETVIPSEIAPSPSRHSLRRKLSYGDYANPHRQPAALPSTEYTVRNYHLNGINKLSTRLPPSYPSRTQGNLFAFIPPNTISILHSAVLLFLISFKLYSAGLCDQKKKLLGEMQRVSTSRE